MAIRSASEIAAKLLKSTEQLRSTVETLRTVGFVATVKDFRKTNEEFKSTVRNIDKASDVFGGIGKKLTSLHKTSEAVLSRIQERWQGFADKVFVAAATVAASAYEQSMKRITQEAPRAERSALYRITYNIQADLGAMDDEVRAAVEPLAEINMPLRPMKEWVKLSVKAGKVLGISAGDFGKMAANLHTINVTSKATERSMSGLAALAHKGYMSLSEIPGVLETAGQLMQDLGVYGDKAFKKAVQGVGALRAALNNLGISNWEQASSGIIDLVKGMVDYTNEESQRAVAVIAATTGKTQTEVIQRVKTDIGGVFGDLMTTLNKQIKYYAGSQGMIEMLMGDPRTLESYISMIQHTTGISSDVIRTAMSRSLKAYKDVVERTGDANKALQEYNKTLKHYTTGLYENYKQTVKQQEATKQFEKLYTDIKGMVNELFGTLQEAGHAFMVSVGMPFLKVGKIIVAVIVKPIHALIQSFIKLNDVTGGLLAVFAAFNMVLFGMRTSILLDLVNYWKSFAGWVGKTFPGISKTLTSVRDGVTSIGESLWSSLGKQAPKATSKVEKAVTGVKSVFSDLSKSSARDAAQMASAVPKGIIKPLAKAQHMIQSYRMFMLRSAKNMFAGIVKASAVFIDNTIASVNAALAVEGGFVKKSMALVSNFLSSNILSLQSGVKGLRKSILKATADYSGFGSVFVKSAGSAIGKVMVMFEGLMAFIATGPGMIIAGVVAAIGTLTYYLSTHTSKEIEKFFASLPEKVHSFLESIVQSISRLPDLIGPIMSGVLDASEKVMSTLIENLPTLVVAIGKALWKTMGYLLIYAVKIPVALIKSIWKAFDKLFWGLPGKIASGIGDAFLSIMPDSIVNAFTTAWQWVKKKLPKWIKWLFGIDDLGSKKQAKQTAKGSASLIGEYEKYAMQNIARNEGFYADTTQMQLSRFKQPEPVKVPIDKSRAVVDEIYRQADKARKASAEVAKQVQESHLQFAQQVTKGPQELMQKIPTGAGAGEGLTGTAKVITDALTRLFDKLFAKLDMTGLMDRAKQASAGWFESAITAFNAVRDQVFTDENKQRLLQASSSIWETVKSGFMSVSKMIMGDDAVKAVTDSGLKFVDNIKSGINNAISTVKDILHPRATTPKLPELQPGDNPQVYEHWQKYISAYKATGKATLLGGGKAYAATVEGLEKPAIDPVMLVTDALSAGGTGIARGVVQMVVEGVKSAASQFGLYVAKMIPDTVLPLIQGEGGPKLAEAVAAAQPVTMTAHEPIQTMPAMTTPAAGENLVLADEDLKTSTTDMVSLLRRIERNTAKPSVVAVDKGGPEDKTDFRMKLIHDLTF